MICLIPFRKGSKRVPHKNIKLFNGVSLFNETLNKAMQVNHFTKRILATDYSYGLIKEYLKFNYSSSVSFYIRSESNVTEPAVKYIDDVINEYKVRDEEDICLLQPTCPLRSVTDIYNAVDLYLKNRHKYKTLVSVQAISPAVKLYSVDSSNVGTNLYLGDDNKGLIAEGHKLKNMLYMRNSSIYIFNVGYFKKNRTIFDTESMVYEMPWYRSVDINTHEDFEFAQKLSIKNDGGLTPL